MRPRVCPKRRSPSALVSVLIMRTIVLLLRTAAIASLESPPPKPGGFLVMLARLRSRSMGSQEPPMPQDKNDYIALLRKRIAAQDTRKLPKHLLRGLTVRGQGGAPAQEGQGIDFKKLDQDPELQQSL